VDFDGVDIVIYGPGRTSLSLAARSWLEDGRLVGMEVNPDIPASVATSIRATVSPEAETAAREGFDSFHAQIDDEYTEGSLSSTIIARPDEFNVHDFRASLGGVQYRVIAIEDPFPLVIPIVVGVCALAAGAGHHIKIKGLRKLARQCIDEGGTATIVDASGATVTWDGRVKIDLKGYSSFSCVRPQRNQ
jgi:hypothetical protein